jgi:hypothetical protein
VVVDRLLPDLRVGVRQRAELVVVVLERVGVDRAEADAEVLGVPAQRGEVVDQVPRDVQGDQRRQTGEPVAASAIFSCTVRGVPAEPNTLNRVPELP